MRLGRVSIKSMAIVRELFIRTGAYVLGNFIISVLAFIGVWGFLASLVGSVVIAVWAAKDGLPPSTAFLYLWVMFVVCVALCVLLVWAWYFFIPSGRQKKRARIIGKLYAEAVALRNHAASLRVLDAATLAKMETVQEQLVEKIRDLAPEQAINLDTLNLYDPGKHIQMALQDPKRTLEFSELLLRIKKILEGYR